MGFIDALKFIKSKMKKAEDPVESLSDDETRDKYLRSLRRQRRVQMEEVEKERLIQDIARFNKERTKRYMYGVNKGVNRMQAVKRLSVLRGQMLRSKKQKRACFLGKGKI